MKAISTSLLIVLLLAVAPFAASAVTISYTLNNSTVPHTSPSITYPFTLEESGVTLTGTQSASFPVHSVFSSGIDFFPNASALNLTLQFDEDVIIQSLSFGDVSGTMTFSVNGGDTFAASVGTVSLPSPIAIAADTPFIINGSGASNGSTYAELNGITVDAVPEPAVGAMALGALAVLALRRRQ